MAATARMKTKVSEKTGKRIATAESLLRFANWIRECGGADPLPALLNSVPGDPQACLIAKALNFDSVIQPLGDREYPNGDGVWAMIPDERGLAPDEADDVVRKLAERAGLNTVRMRPDEAGDAGVCRYSGTVKHTDWWAFDHPLPQSKQPLVIKLPKAIGNAAEAFDSRDPEFSEWL